MIIWVGTRHFKNAHNSKDEQAHRKETKPQVRIWALTIVRILPNIHMPQHTHAHTTYTYTLRESTSKAIMCIQFSFQDL